MNNIFYLNKDEASEFQDKCVIAIFLYTHIEVTFIKYIKANCFLGTVDGIETTIYLFKGPESSEIKKISSSVTVFRYNTGKKNKDFTYYDLNDNFKLNFKEFRNDIYNYILNNFFNNWSEYWGKLFVSKPPLEFVNLYKYKSADISKLKVKHEKSNRFEQFLDGTVIFSDPTLFNDPFDCDCNFSDLKSKKKLLWNAFNKFKYEDAFCKIDWKDIDLIKDEKEFEADNIKNTVSKIIKHHKKEKSKKYNS
jgi:hypothetical protein